MDIIIIDLIVLEKTLKYLFLLSSTEIQEVSDLVVCYHGNLSEALTRKTVEVRSEKVKSDLSVSGVSMTSCTMQEILSKYLK